MPRSPRPLPLPLSAAPPHTPQCVFPGVGWGGGGGGGGGRARTQGDIANSNFKTLPIISIYTSTILLVARLSKSDKRIVPQHSVSSYLAATNASPPSPSPVINGGGIVVRSLCRIAASERCLRRYSVSFRGESESEWPSAADKLAVTTTASKADEDDELKGQCHQNCNLIQRKASEIN
jgi:hypothetical protein